MTISRYRILLSVAAAVLFHRAESLKIYDFHYLKLLYFMSAGATNKSIRVLCSFHYLNTAKQFEISPTFVRSIDYNTNC